MGEESHTASVSVKLELFVVVSTTAHSQPSHGSQAEFNKKDAFEPRLQFSKTQDFNER